MNQTSILAYLVSLFLILMVAVPCPLRGDTGHVEPTAELVAESAAELTHSEFESSETVEGDIPIIDDGGDDDDDEDPVDPPVEDDPPEEELVVSTPAHASPPEVSLNMGSIGSVYTIEVPPGPNGMTPTVNLSYNSSRKTGIAGTGWDLNVDTIQRSTKYGVCYSCNDFVHNGQDLVPVSVDANGFGRYRPEKEKEFSLIEYLSTGEWKVTLKNGTKHYYRDQRIAETLNLETVNGYGVFDWHLYLSEDSNGNRIHYSYLYDEANNQVYLEKIEYASYLQVPGEEYYYTILFYYEFRPDNDTGLSYVSGVKSETDKRLLSIAVTKGSGDERIRAYHFEYAQSPSTYRSLLARITTYGSDYQLSGPDYVLEGGSSLPPQEMTYYAGSGDFSSIPSSLNALADEDFTPEQFTYPTLTGDWNGDNRQDIARVCDDRIRFFISTENDGHYCEEYHALTDLFPVPESGCHPDGEPDPETNDIPMVCDNPADYVNNNTHPIFTGDWDGDGRTDIGRLGNDGIKFYLSRDDGFVLFDVITNHNFSSFYFTPTFTGDFNGDGKTDFGGQQGVNGDTVVWLSNGTGFSENLCTIDLSTFPLGEPPAGTFPAGSNTAYPYIIGDFTGDGQMEIGRVHEDRTVFVKFRDNQFVYHTEFEDFSPEQLFSDSNKSPIITGDFNGDGLTDIGRASELTGEHDFKGIYIYYSTGPGFTSDPVEVPDPTPFYTLKANSSRVLTGDFNGDGRSDILSMNNLQTDMLFLSTGDGFILSKGTDGVTGSQWDLFPGFQSQGETPVLTGDFTGDGKTGACMFGDHQLSNNTVFFQSPDSAPADLLHEIAFTRGSRSTIDYLPSSEYENGNMPGVIQTVSAITTGDGLGNTATTGYGFSGKFYDFEDNEYRSFEKGIKVLPNDTREVTAFLQDKYLDGLIELTSLYSSDNALLSITMNDWNSDEFGNGSSFVSLESTRTSLVENSLETAWLLEAYEYY
ncbi:MAG: hypothetical protein D3926_00605, partial [Desulfobacteraceae bacterium]